MKGEATPTRSVPLPVEEKDEETEEAREEEEGGIMVIVGGGGSLYIIAMLIKSLYIFIKNIKMGSTVSHSFYRCHCSI